MEQVKKKVLMVEDNPGDARLLQETFKQLTDGEFELVHEPSLQGALKRLAHEEMDYILLDLFLPESSGLETLERINQVKSKARLIVVTGLYDEKIAASVLEKGADFFVSKDHSDLNALVRVLRDYVEFQKKSN